MELYDLVFLVCNLFMAYVIYKCHMIFYTERRVTKAIEVSAYGLYFVVNSAVYLLIKIPLVTALSALVLIFLPSLCYLGNLKKRILSTAIIYSLLLCIELAVVSIGNSALITLHTPFTYQSIFGVIAFHIITYVVVLALGGLRRKKSNLPIPTAYWLCLLIVPTGTMTLLFALLSTTTIGFEGIIGSVCAVLSINLVAFYLYDRLTTLAAEQMNSRLLGEQARYYENQLELMKTTLSDTKRLRHDLKNQLSPLYRMAEEDDKPALLARIGEMMEAYGDSVELSHSGNAHIDSILNFKLGQAQKSGVEVTASVLVPADLQVPSFDLAIILGNLLDNAIEAALTSPTDCWLDIKVKYSKGRLLVTLSNAFDGVLKKSGDRLESRKADTENHGYGLDSVRSALTKYDGALQLSHSGNSFTAKVLLYV